MRATTCFVIAAGVALAWVIAARDRDLPVPAKRESVDAHVLPERAFVYDDRSGHAPTVIVATDEAGADAGLSEFVSWKYRWLFEAVQESEGQVLRAALLRRERLAVAVNTAVQRRDPAAKAEVSALRSRLEEADERLRELVHPATFAEYMLLKDADAELYRLREYADGISNLAPLSPAQQRAVLFAKLMYKQQYQQLVTDSGLETSDLPPSQRRYAFETVARELEAYRNNFLLQAQQALADEQQYVLLQNYENTEFAEELAKLRLATLGE